MELKAYLNQKRNRVEEMLIGLLLEPQEPSRDLFKAMQYSLFAGGKRLRPILCLAGSDAVGGDEGVVLPVACALELIHTYSLIHDDLPSMDDDDFRRGKPTNHKVFGEAPAILAGDGLLTEAFRLMASSDLKSRVKPEVLLDVIATIAEAAGHRGMVGGQAVDIQSEGRVVEPSVVEFIHTHKTGALIAASVTAGALLGGGEEQQLQAIGRYGRKIGLAFQIADDILNIEGDSQELGKAVGSDHQKGKITYPGVFGLNASKQTQRELVDSAVNILAGFDHRADPLRQIASYIIERNV
ncbi:polyprenyl synthetase family protein [Thermodesulfobacteriota bacterium]